MEETATFAAGCFWGVEAAFAATPGVISTRVGYTGGHTKDPSYRDVFRDTTGHAEAVEVTFDPTLVSYDKQLAVFFDCHNPTELNRQGADVGSQYRSAILFHSPAQKAAAEAAISVLAASGKYRTRIVTQIAPAETFYPAEDYHQKYLEKRGLAVCHTS